MPPPTRTDIGGLIAHTALQFIGHAYCVGGAPGPNWQGCWDCSSFANSVVGGMVGQSIPWYPNGSYNGTAHGPNTVVWLAAQGNEVGAVPRAAMQPGDLPTWPTHMGIAIDNQRMVSAENPTDGTQIGFVDGFIPGEPLTILRLASVQPVKHTLPPFNITGEKTALEAIRQAARAIRSMIDADVRWQHVGKHGWRV